MSDTLDGLAAIAAMLEFKSVTLRNFLSTGMVTQAVDLATNGLTLILGNGVDSRGEPTRNGAGKSSILNAICYALYGKPLDTKSKADNLINELNLKGMLVTLEFVFRGDIYRIERGRKPNVLRLFKGGDEVKPDNDAMGENVDTDAEILRIVGMDHTMFVHTVGLNTGTIPFLKEGAPKQREVIEKLLGVTKISERAKVLSNRIKDTKAVVQSETATISAIIEANTRIRQTIDATQSKSQRWDAEHEAAITRMALALEKAVGHDFDAEIEALDAIEAYDRKAKEYRDAAANANREASAIEREAKAIEAEIERMRQQTLLDDPKGVIPALERTRRQIVEDQTRTERRLTDFADDVTRAESDLTKIAHEIEHANGSDCSTCGQSLVGTDHLGAMLDRLTKRQTSLEAKVKAAIAALDAEASKLPQFEDRIAKADADIVAARDVLIADKVALVAEYEAIRDAASEVRVEQDGFRKSAADAERALTVMGDRPVSAFVSKDAVYRAKQERDRLERDLEVELAKENPHTDQVLALEATLQVVDETRLNETRHMLRHEEYLLKLLTKPDSFIRKEIIDQNLHTLNDRMTHYLDKLGLPHEVEIQPDLDVTITYMGRDRDFSQFSRGEQNRVIIAMSWAFRDVWENLNHSVNLLMVDELLDSGIDATGAEAALNVLKGFGMGSKNVFLISHKEELRGRIDRTLMVTKEDNFTRFEYDAF